MSTAIRVENLGKKYVISHQKQQRYVALRDVMEESVKKLGRSIIKTVVAQKGDLVTSTKEDFWALKDISFEINQGDRVGIIGRNGAGKSTLLKILSRITEPTTGRISLKGRVASLLEVGTGFHPELTGRENIYLNGAILGMSRTEIKNKFDEIIDFAEVEKFLDTPVKRYSSGMYVRLAFAVAAHLEPEILIVDEVLAVGDAEFQKKCLGKMEQVGHEGRTVLFVSHNMGAISRLCSQCIVLNNGQLLFEDTTHNAISRYLASSVTDSNVFEQKHDDSKDMNIRKVVLNPGSPGKAKEFTYEDPIVVRIEYEVNKRVSNCTVWMALENTEGVMVFTTADFDQCPDILKEREPGYYQADIHIPGRWLNTGQYVVIVGIVQNNPVQVFDRVEALRFETNEVGSPASLLEVGSRRGVLQPLLRWDNVKQEG